MKARSIALVSVLALVLSPMARAGDRGPVLHEPIPADARDAVALTVSLDGDLPAAIQTPHNGIVPAPDPDRNPNETNAPYAPNRNDTPDTTFHPDRDTARPDVLPYDDPFTPSTAPFKRMSAFDTVDASYTLSVMDPGQKPMFAGAPAAGSSDDSFYADMVVDLFPHKRVRIPSVGPGARIVRARAGVGTADVAFHLYKDGAENWFIEGERMTRARLVMELAIPRAAFGGDFGNPSWGDLMSVPPLPANVARSAEQVRTRIGVSQKARPRDAIAKLVAYFRAFVDSEDPPAPTRDIYLDLALSQKGVCRHRAFAFLVTALSLGIPTRMIVNEAHAWVEVHDGKSWRRIDLGGAGRTLHDDDSSNVPYEPPSDPFTWPAGATRGDDLADRARNGGQSGPTKQSGANGNGNGSASGASSSAADAASANGNQPSAASASASANAKTAANEPKNAPLPDDERPRSKVRVEVLDGDAQRGSPIHVRGDVTADGEPCAHSVVAIVLRSSAARGPVLQLGSLATDERGAYDGTIVLPATMPLGDYDVAAVTPGDARCGRGSSP